MLFPIVSDLERRLPLYVTGIGREPQPPVHRPEGFPHHQLTYCARGRGTFRAEGDLAHLEEGDGFHFEAGLPHDYVPAAGGWETHWVTFDGPAALDVLAVLGLGRSSVASSLQSGDVPVLHSAMFRLLEQGRPGCIAETSALLQSMLASYARALREGASPSARCERTLDPVLAYMERNYRDPIRLDALADLAHVTPFHLCRLFRSQLGGTPMRHLLRIRMTRAKQLLLKEPDLKIGAVSLAVGYRDASYFCSAFRSLEGTTPQAFRRIHGVGSSRS